MKIPKIYLYLMSKYVFRLFHIHTGFNDRSLIWIVNKWPLNILFMEIQTNYNFKKLYNNKDRKVFGIHIDRIWNNLMFKLYVYYTLK